MKLIAQRVKKASVTVNGNLIGNIGKGLLVLVGITHNDTVFDANYLAEKTVKLRIFEDEHGKMNRPITDNGGEILAVSQFTLYGDCRKGNRPSFIEAAHPEKGERLFNAYVTALRERNFQVPTGQFGASMQVSLQNDGPVTLILESTGRKKG